MINNKGFSIVESLIVAVILIVVILISGIFVVNMLEKEHKQVFKTEVLRAKVCYPIEWLKANNLFILESKEEYMGSVLIEANEEGQVINYTAWIANQDFLVNKANLTNLNIKGKAYESGIISDKKEMTISLNCENEEGQTLRK